MQPVKSAGTFVPGGKRGIKCKRRQTWKIKTLITGEPRENKFLNVAHVIVCCVGGAGMAQWFERSPPTNVTRVRFPDPASYVG